MPALSLTAVCPWVGPSTSLGPAAFDLSDERGLGSESHSFYFPFPLSTHLSQPAATGFQPTPSATPGRSQRVKIGLPGTFPKRGWVLSSCLRFA